MTANEEGQTQPAVPPSVAVGRHTYGYDTSTFKVFVEGARVEVGAFCSIGPEVRILAGGEHLTARATTFPLKTLLFDPAGGNREDAIDRGTTIIGHDVWIGLGATILAGVVIGHGAIIGAGAVVSRPVPPYAVVVGNPAYITRYRLQPEIQERLLALGWWEWDDEEIWALKRAFLSDVETFLTDAERLHDPTPEDGLVRRLRALSPELMTPPHSTERRALAADGMVEELNAQIGAMRSTAAWRAATRYWRVRERLLRVLTRR